MRGFPISAKPFAQEREEASKKVAKLRVAKLQVALFRIPRKRNPQPATFFEKCFFYVGGVGMEKAGSLLWACLFCIQIPTYFSKYIY